MQKFFSIIVALVVSISSLTAGTYVQASGWDSQTIMKEPSSALTAEMRAAIEAKLDSIPAEKRQVFYTVLVGRIDAAIAKSLSKKQHKTAAALREIRAMVIERLNETE